MGMGSEAACFSGLNIYHFSSHARFCFGTWSAAHIVSMMPVVVSIVTCPSCQVLILLEIVHYIYVLEFRGAVGIMACR